MLLHKVSASVCSLCFLSVGINYRQHLIINKTEIRSVKMDKCWWHLGNWCHFIIIKSRMKICWLPPSPWRWRNVTGRESKRNFSEAEHVCEFERNFHDVWGENYLYFKCQGAQRRAEESITQQEFFLNFILLHKQLWILQDVNTQKIITLHANSQKFTLSRCPDVHPHMCVIHSCLSLLILRMASVSHRDERCNLDC